MTLLKLGINNVRRNFRNYFSYFVSIVSAVFILMTFFSIYFNERIQSFSSSRFKVAVIFKVSAFIVIIFSAVFIWYSNDYFLRSKKKEIAIYSLVGMKKKEIGILMFFENIFLGILALIVGIPAGVFMSGFFLKLLGMCIKAPIQMKAEFHMMAVIMTIFAFMAIFIANAVKAYKVIYKYKLIELLHADKEGEREPEFSGEEAIGSVIMVAIGYLMALTMDMSKGGSILALKGSAIVILIVGGTYLLFNNFIIYALKRIENNKRIYYKGENLLGISQLVYRIKGNSNLLATITVISTVAITALCFTFSFDRLLDSILPGGAPFDISYKGGDNGLNTRVEEIINSSGENQITYKNDFVLINGKGTTDNYIEPGSEDSSFGMYIISLSEFDEIIENSHLNETKVSERVTDFKLDGAEDCFFIEVSNLPEGRRRLAGNTLKGKVGGKNVDFHIADSDIKGILGVNFQKPTVIVKDEYYNSLLEDSKNNVTILRAYKFNNGPKCGTMVEKVRDIMPYEQCYSSYYGEYINLHGLYGSFVFVGLFLGILFVFSTGGMMYYKQITEAVADKSRFRILLKLGVRKKEAARVIYKQQSFIFGVPIAAALINSIVALKAYVNYLSTGGSPAGIYGSIAVMMGIYVIVYLLYYFLTVKSTSKILLYN